VNSPVGPSTRDLTVVQRVSRKPSISIINSSNVRDEDLAKEGADKVRVKYLIDERHGSRNFALRLYTLAKGGHTPLDEHLHEHQVYVLSGRGLVRQSNEGGSSKLTLQRGDTIFVPSNAVHQFSNEQDEPFVFLCVKGNPDLYQHKELVKTSDESNRNYC